MMIMCCDVSDLGTESDYDDNVLALITLVMMAVMFQT